MRERCDEGVRRNYTVLSQKEKMYPFSVTKREISQLIKPYLIAV